MSDWVELANLLDEHMSERDFGQGCRLACGYSGEDRDEHLASAIIAAGYRKQRVVDTIFGLDSLRPGTVLRDSKGKIVEIPLGGAWWPYIENGSGGVSSTRCKISLPATILYELEDAA